jgi:hypothetical protein
MSQARKTPYTSVSVTPEAAAALRRLSVSISARVDRRVSQSDAIRIAEKLAFMHYASVGAAAEGVIEI